jgi:putative ABC transport system permease protein
LWDYFKRFLKLIAVAMVIATPVAWWAMSKWLQAFAYRIDIAGGCLRLPALLPFYCIAYR